MQLRRTLTIIKHAVRLKPGVCTAGGGLIITGIGAVLADQAMLGWATIVFGIAVFLWGVTIHGRALLWERWWLGPIGPHINAALLDFPYEQGTVISGIKWEPDFSHVHVRMANQSKEDLLDLNFVVFLDRHIIRSACRSTFANCSIGPDGGPVGQITLIGTDKDGNKIAIVPDQTQGIDIAPFHRIICAKLPSGASIDIDIATVLPGNFPHRPLWGHSDPTKIQFEGTYSVRGITQTVGWYQPLGKHA